MVRTLYWRILRWLCGLIDHRGADWEMDVTGEFVVRDCGRCATVIITSMIDGHQKEDYEAVLDRWLTDWRDNGEGL